MNKKSNFWIARLWKDGVNPLFTGLYAVIIVANLLNNHWFLTSEQDPMSETTESLIKNITHEVCSYKC